MIGTSASFSNEQVQAVVALVATLALSNLANIVGAAWAFFRRIRKMRYDINQAHEKIRRLEQQLSVSKQEEHHASQSRDSLPE